MKHLSPDVLVVDDEPSVRSLMCDVLRMKGFEPRVACHGLDALDQCLRGEGAPDLLVTDVVMPPHFNGVELVRRLRVLRPDMKSLYVSAYAPDSEVSHAFGDPLSDFLPKPLSPIVLAQTVEKMLEGTAGAAGMQARRKAGTVLLLVSDGSGRQTLKQSLTAGGFWVLEAKHPNEAQFIGRWNEGSIHLLIMDVPQVAGKGAWLRRLQHAHPGMRTIFVEETEDRFRFTPEGNPDDPTDLMAGIRKLLERKASVTAT